MTRSAGCFPFRSMRSGLWFQEVRTARSSCGVSVIPKTNFFPKVSLIFQIEHIFIFLENILINLYFYDIVYFDLKLFIFNFAPLLTEVNLLQCLRVHQTSILDIDLKCDLMLSSDSDGNVILFQVKLNKFNNMPFVQDEEYLTKKNEIKVSSEPVWRVMLNTTNQTVICCMPTKIKVFKIKARNNSIKLRNIKYLTSSTSLFGHSEFLPLIEIKEIQGQFDGMFFLIKSFFKFINKP